MTYPIHEMIKIRIILFRKCILSLYTKMTDIDLVGAIKQKHIKSGVDVLMTSMELADGKKVSGSEKTMIVVNSIQTLLQMWREGKAVDVISETIASQLEQLITSDMIYSLISYIVSASKNMLNINPKTLKKLKFCSCFQK
jgi:hypothetical protein